MLDFHESFVFNSFSFRYIDVVFTPYLVFIPKPLKSSMALLNWSSRENVMRLWSPDLKVLGNVVMCIIDIFVISLD